MTGDISIRKLITWSTIAVILLLVAGNVIVWQSSQSLENAEAEKNRLTDALLTFKDVRYHVILIQQFLTEVDWTGDTDGLDYLIVDTPPGTSNEHISTVN